MHSHPGGVGVPKTLASPAQARRGKMLVAGDACVASFTRACDRCVCPDPRTAAENDEESLLWPELSGHADLHIGMIRRWSRQPHD
jgi:hypothetical protein